MTQHRVPLPFPTPWRRRTLAPLAFVALLLGGAGLAPAGTADRPDILLITIDTLRADRMSSYGYPRETTPNLDRLIEAGARFSSARTVEPLTAPALISMLTARYPHDHGTSRNGLRMREDLPSLPKLLRDAGYRTGAIVGNWTLRHKLSGLGEHFEDYRELLTRKRWFGLVSSEAGAEDLTAEALDWIAAHRSAGSDRPFFLWVHYVEPHAPYKLHRDFLPALGIPETENVKPSDRYDTEVAYVDRSVGELLRGTGALDPAAGVLTVFTSDHGESLGEHNYWGHGRQLFEPGLRVPMAVTWPGRVAPRTVEAPSLNMDIAPTVASLLGLDLPAEFEGHDWTPVFDGAEEPTKRVTRHQAHRGAVLSRHDSDLARRAGLLEVALVLGQRKEIFRVQNRRTWSFDLASDPGETERAEAGRATPTEGLQEWMRLVYAGLNRLDEQTPEPLDPESVRQLQALGYVD